MTSTYQMVRELSWSYLEQLARQQVLQVQSATDTPKKVVLGERPVMADGNESNVLLLKEAGGPIEVVYAAEGTPSIVQPSAIFVAAPHPNAARLFQNYLFGVEGQELFVNLGGLRSLRTPLSAIKVWKDDPAAVETQGEEIKRRYSLWCLITRSRGSTPRLHMKQLKQVPLSVSWVHGCRYKPSAGRPLPRFDLSRSRLVSGLR